MQAASPAPATTGSTSTRGRRRRAEPPGPPAAAAAIEKEELAAAYRAAMAVLGKTAPRRRSARSRRAAALAKKRRSLAHRFAVELLDRAAPAARTPQAVFWEEHYGKWRHWSRTLAARLAEELAADGDKILAVVDAEMTRHVAALLADGLA